MSCANLGKSTIVGVWAKAETTCGTFVMPAATDVILPTGFPAVNQEFPTTDGLEISESLDITEQFQSAAQPVSFSLPMYVRVPAAASLGNAIQGDVVFQSLLGSGVAGGTVSAAVATTWTVGQTTSLGFDTLAGGWLPDVGVITVGTEKILYRGITWASSTAGSFDNVERAYAGTTAAEQADTTAFTLTSRYFRLDTDSPAFSTVVRTDHTVYYITGCAANSATVGITNEGGLQWSFDCQALSFEWAGKSTLAAQAASGQADVVVPDAKLYSVGAFVKNTTKNKDNTDGYEITAINYSTNTLTLETNLDTNWEIGDIVEGYVPGSTSVANTIENRYTSVYIDATSTTLQNTDLTVSCPKQFISDEVGNTYPTAWVEDQRSITGTMTLYARAADTKYLYDNTQRTEKVVHMLFGDTDGESMAIAMRRTKLTNPTSSENGPTINMALNLTALGKIDTTTSEVGENSIDVVTI